MKNKELEEELNLLLAYQLLYGSFDNQKCIEWSINMMQQGINSENLSILAGLDPRDSYSVEYYVQKIIIEFGLNKNLDEEDLFRKYVFNIAQQVIDAQLSPQEGLSILYNLILQCSQYNFDTAIIYQFYYLSEDIESLDYCTHYYTGLTDENKDEAIVNEMKLLLLDCDHQYQSDNELIYCYICKRLSYRVFDKGRWFSRSKQCICRQSHSKEYLSWGNIPDQKQILEILQNNSITVHQK